MKLFFYLEITKLFTKITPEILMRFRESDKINYNTVKILPTKIYKRKY